jgi:adenylate kinase
MLEEADDIIKRNMWHPLKLLNLGECKIILNNPMSQLRMEKYHVAIIGMPGSGKRTQSQFLEEIGYNHLSTGKLFRGVLRDPWYIGLARMLDASISEMRGIDGSRYDSDGAVNRFITQYVSEYGSVPTVFDGYPRTIPQAKHLDSLIENYAVVYLNVHKSEAERRLALMQGRRREDSPEAIQKRMSLYEEDTLPLIPYYRMPPNSMPKRPFITIDGNNDVDTVADRIADALKRL